MLLAIQLTVTFCVLVIALLTGIFLRIRRTHRDLVSEAKVQTALLVEISASLDQLPEDFDQALQRQSQGRY